MTQERPASLVSRRDLLQGAALALLAAGGAGRAMASGDGAKSDPRLALVNRLCELVIPATDTTGGAGVGAAQFVLLALDQHMAGLDAGVLARVRAQLDAAAGPRPFLALDGRRQLELLTELDRRAFLAGPSGAPGAAVDGSPEQAWRSLKPAIIAGYYTSETGASRELVYEPVPESTRTNFTLTADYRARSNEGFGGDL